MFNLRTPIGAISAGISLAAMFCCVVFAYASVHKAKYPKKYNIPEYVKMSLISEHEANKPTEPKDILADWLTELLPIDRLSVSRQGLERIKVDEGFKSEPYLLKGEKRCTIGYGSTYGFDNKPMPCNHKPVKKDYAEKLLIYHINTKITPYLRKCINTYLPQGTYDVFVSLAYNVGADKVCKSDAVKQLNNGQWQLAVDQLDKWVIANGKVNKGLVLRRNREQKVAQVALIEKINKVSQRLTK